MAGETIKTEAVCLRIVPWSRTSHIVSWLTPLGVIGSVVKGAVRPKSAFLGQYDLNYTCEILYYARAKGDLHALRECVPLQLRETLREDFRALSLADYYRATVAELAPGGPEARDWFDLLSSSLDSLCTPSVAYLQQLLSFELNVLKLSGLTPDLEADSGYFALRGERQMPVSPAVAQCIRNPLGEKKMEILLDAARAIGVFYSFHLDCAVETRRTVLKLIS